MIRRWLRRWLGVEAIGFTAGYLETRLRAQDRHIRRLRMKVNTLELRYQCAISKVRALAEAGAQLEEELEKQGLLSIGSDSARTKPDPDPG